MDTTFIWVFFIVILALFAFIALLLRRRNNSFELIIARDNRRNIILSGRTHYNLRYGTIGSLKAVKIYNHLISIFPVRVLTEIADPRPFLWYGRTVVGVIGPTGTAEDDSLVLIPPPIFSKYDIDKNVSKMRNVLYNTMLKFAPSGDAPLQEQLIDFLNKSITDKMVQQELGPINTVEPDRIIPRSHKVAYVSEQEDAVRREVRHEGGWAKFAAMAPGIFVVILIIVAGIFMYIAYQGNANNTKANQAYVAAINDYVQATQLRIASALAKVGIYGYNVSTPAVPTLGSNASVLPSVPSVPSTSKT
ncbi:MAG: hypothetical protein QXS03_01455 [Candidatus Micrarchaeaceae archaeon]